MVMRDGVRRTGMSLTMAGVDPRATWRSLRGLPRFVRDRRDFSQLSAAAGTPAPRWRSLLPVIGDGADAAGAAGEYFLTDLWAARKIHQRQPVRHLDVGSRIDGLVAHLLTFMPVDVVDVRPLRSDVEGLRFVQADGADLTGVSAPSVSSLHALEHFGLGRYGDRLDPLGHVKGLDALGRAVDPGGDLYVGYPVGRARVEFNAHRIIDPRLAVERLHGLQLASFAVVADGTVTETTPDAVASERYVLGLYHFTRDAAS